MAQPAAGKPTAGLLQIPAAATQKSASPAPAKKAPKPPTPRLKLVIRRLPPGLTQSELESALGEEWTVGGGKVDWLQYKPGKVSKDPAKPSRPARAYVHVVSSECITPFSDTVRQTSFQDARQTSHDPVLLGPPTLEFAPYAKTPGSRVRKDARQGTIDQDSDFIAFLESLTQPIAKSAPVDTVDGEEKKKDTVTTTPLVQFIKDKKASKGKDGSGKSSKRADKEAKLEKVHAKKLLQRADKDTASTAPEKKAKGEKAAKEAGKAAKLAAAGGAKSNKSGATATKEGASASERKRERGNVAAAAKILQRDLGLSPAGARRRAKAECESSPSGDGSKNEIPPKSVKGGSTKAKEGGSPSSRGTPDTATPNTSTPPPTKPSKAAKNKPAASPTPTATQAFLKHANPSQGVTESLLEEAFSLFGAVAKVEIDKKKGFGYVDFAEPAGLQQAMAASPVSVAQSQVVVLERKANPSEKARKANPPAGGNKAKTGNAEGNGGASSRGSRGGRGGRNKGSKGGPGSERPSEKMSET
ncbi:hypothetical protein N7474_007576 [Penicillium riverlandense]|uniref:uncharacterized protein n=1 Tax=Penicillium riverlandense TaxID=1903569 RepID=UPI0025470D77|nr:uncharacterized protein N7474_007576 [Penicillium riverlandense]KAJ5811275.1 hypothetical protein N7474_007576 [Penicillium riverlandense]